MRTIAICTHKGGTGKTTTAHALGAYIQKHGGKVLYLDMDAQHNLTDALNADTTGATMYNVLRQDLPITRCIIDLGDGCGIVAANEMLGAADIWKGKGDHAHILAKALQDVNKAYTHCVIDCARQLDLVNINALYAADLVLMPAKADAFNITAMQQNIETINTIKAAHPIKPLGVLLTMYNKRSVLNQQMAASLEQIAKQMRTRVLATPIRSCMALAQCEAMQQSIFDYAPRSNGALDYTAAFDEIKKELKL